jgi:hypothetical protein
MEPSRRYSYLCASCECVWGGQFAAVQLIPNLHAKRKWVVSCTFRPLYPRYSLSRRLVRFQSGSGRFEEQHNRFPFQGFETRFLGFTVRIRHVVFVKLTGGHLSAMQFFCWRWGIVVVFNNPPRIFVGSIVILCLHSCIGVPNDRPGRPVNFLTCINFKLFCVCCVLYLSQNTLDFLTRTTMIAYEASLRSLFPIIFISYWWYNGGYSWTTTLLHVRPQMLDTSWDLWSSGILRRVEW